MANFCEMKRNVQWLELLKQSMWVKASRISRFILYLKVTWHVINLVFGCLKWRGLCITFSIIQCYCSIGCSYVSCQDMWFGIFWNTEMVRFFTCRRYLHINKCTIIYPSRLHSLIILSVLFYFFAADGMTYSFGIFYVEFLDYFNEGKGYTAWIISILVGVTLCSGNLIEKSIENFFLQNSIVNI